MLKDQFNGHYKMRSYYMPISKVSLVESQEGNEKLQRKSQWRIRVPENYAIKHTYDLFFMSEMFACLEQPCPMQDLKPVAVVA